MNSSEIRNTFLEYFEKNNHQIVHSSSLIPENDPTLMFANSGMVQFKNIFTGKEKRDYKRAATSQKCVRAGGKHNDLDNVGYTTRHHTFFEMLGNFSFGDYFKDQAIEFSWNLITKEFGINKDRLLVTVYNEDLEAYNLWKKIAGLTDEKIIKINTADNFWSMGDTGPCGPCSEIFYDHGEKYFGGPPGSKDEDGDRFIEIWNLVFMQYEQISKDERINLPKPSIDTGMGLERVVALLQNTNDNYETDIFTSLINKSKELCNNFDEHNSASHKIIADHLRSASFLISDGVLPSNEGRGYVLRRIMRRGMRHAHSLGNKDPVFHKIFPILLSDMSESYPELLGAKDLIENTLLNEETQFKETIDKGLKILEEEINNSKNRVFSGLVAFKLYDTYGFPLDLTQDYLKNKNIKVDKNLFNVHMTQQKNRARKNWKGIGNKEDNSIWFKLTENLNPTEFVGYKKNTTEGLISKIIINERDVKNLKKGDKAVLILNKTSFYAESGGQVGDQGFLSNQSFKFIVNDTTKIFGKYFLHWGEVVEGTCNIGENLEISIDSNRRNLIKNNHTSTHLLHYSLRNILGKHVTQKGSLVNNEKLRFDFNHSNQIDSNEISKIEILVNKFIKKKFIVKTEILDHKEAIKIGAIALFGEKYGDEVRVVSIGSSSEKLLSIELCGGTHVINTRDIKKFKIINQTSIASGIKRIEAITSEAIDTYNSKIENIVIDKLKKIDEEIIKYKILIKELNIDKKLNFIKNQNSEIYLKDIKKLYEDNKMNLDILEHEKNIKKEKIGKFYFAFLLAKDYPGKSQKQFVDKQKKILKSKSIIVLVSTSENKVSIIIGLTEDISNQLNATNLVKLASLVVGGKGGGGRNDLAQAGGSIVSEAKNIYDVIKKEIIKLS